MYGVFLDLETTGLDYRFHRTIEIAFIICNLNDGTEIESYNRFIKQEEAVWQAADRNSLKINGLTFETTMYGPSESAVAEEIADLFKKNQIYRGKSYFICQNPSFDRIFFSQIIPSPVQEDLQLPYHWLDLASMFWAKRWSEEWSYSGLPKGLMNLSKDSIANHYLLPKEKKPHRAMNGVKHLMTCYENVVGYQKKSAPLFVEK